MWWVIVNCLFLLIGVGAEFNKFGFKSTSVSNISDISSSEIIIGRGGNVSILSTIGGGVDDVSQTFLKVSAAHRSQHEETKVIHICAGMMNIFPYQNREDIWNVPVFAVLKDSDGNDTTKFRLEEGIPFCGMGETKFMLISQLHQRDETFSKDVESIGFLKNGYFKIKQDFYNTDEYCVGRISESEIELNYCSPTCTKVRPCVKKCFPPGEVMGFYPKRAPLPSGDVQFLPTFYDDFPDTGSTVNSSHLKELKPHFIQNRPRRDFLCEGFTAGTHFFPFGDEVAESISTIANVNISSVKFRVQVDGRVFFEVIDAYNCPALKELPPDKFCVDGIRNLGNESKFTNHESEGLVISCPLPNEDILVSLLFGVLMIASSFFLLLTFIVYVLLWHQQNIHGWTIMAHTASLFFAYIFLGMTHIIRVKFVELVQTRFCYINGMLGHFFFLSTFSWLTLISFDLYWTFRSIVPTKKTKGARMVIHLLIGWGLPAVIVIISTTLDNVLSGQCSSIILPKYGEYVCYIQPNAQGFYLYYPVAVSLIFNIIFFCVTIFKLYHYKKNTRMATKNNSNNRQLVGIFIKLFFVMGICWIFEFTSWLHVGSKYRWYWVTIDVLNILQAVAIFYIYVCKPDVLESLETKYPNSLNKYVLRFIRRVTMDVDMKGAPSSRGKASSSAGGLDGEEMKTKTSSLPRSI